MTKVVVAFVVLAFLGAVSATPWEKTVSDTLRGGGDYQSHHMGDVPVLAENGMTFDITTNPDCEIRVCWSYMIKAPKDASEWPRLCKMWKDWQPSDGKFSSQSVSPGEAHLNLYCMSKNGCDYTVKMSGVECGPGEYGNTCRTPTQLPLADVEIPQGEFVLFNVSLSYHWFSNWLNVSVTEKDGKGFLFYMREGDAPRAVSDDSPAVYDDGGAFTGYGTLSIKNPRSVGWGDTEIFEYIFFVSNSNPDTITVSVNVTESHCGRWTHGTDCKYTAPPMVSGIAYQIPNSEKTWEYGSITLVDPELPDRDYFSIGIQSLQGQDAPSMYLKYGNIPTSDDYDMKLGGGDEAEELRFYNSGKTNVRTARWFIGVHIAKSSQKGAYGLWFEDDCPNECSLHGECSSHQCQCEKGYRSNWFTCAAEDPPSSGTKGNNSGGGTSGTEIFLYIAFSIETLVILGAIAALVAVVVLKRRAGYDSL